MVTAEAIVNIGKLMLMSKARRERSAFGQRLLEARRAAGLTQLQVSSHLGISQSNLSDLERESESSGFTVQLATLYGCSPHWLATGEGDRSESGVAHGLSLSVVDDSPTVQWEGILEKLPPTFECALPDDALMPDWPKGCPLIWSTTKAPEIGSVVIVKDRHGRPHVRRYAQGKAPDRWAAQATGPGFATFDSIDDGLQVLAVAAWSPMP